MHASSYRERPDYRVNLLARTNVMTAWLREACLATGKAGTRGPHCD